MSGPGDIGGEVSGEEAAWRDLIARFDDPDDRTGAGAPWPASEDLPDEPGSKADSPASAAGPNASPSDTAGPPTEKGRGQPEHDRRPAAPRGPARDGQGLADHDANPAAHGANPAGHGEHPAGRQGDGPADRLGTSPADRLGAGPADRQGASQTDRLGTSPADPQAAGPADRQGASQTDRQGTSPADRQGAGPADRLGAGSDSASRPDQVAGPVSQPLIGFAIPTDRTRVIRPAADPRSYTPAEEQDEPYVPERLPPPAKLDSMTKAALAGVIGGPGYLLIATIFMHWTISPEAALLAVAAFVAGFVTLVIKLGDRSGRDDDDDGAVL